MANRDPHGGDGDEGLDPRLAAGLAALPRELAPPRDLWPGIAGRLDLDAGAAAPSRLPAPAFLRPARPAYWRQAAAALLSAALGAAATFVAMAGGAASPESAAAGAAVPAAGFAPAAYSAGPEAAGYADYRLIEADYLRAKEALWISVYARRGQFSPATLQAVEKNFAILDAAIFDLRQALAGDPGNRRLEEELYRNHRRSLDLLRRLAAST